MLFEPYNNKKLLNLEIIKDKVFNDFISNKLHHSLIFLGNKGLGKSTLCYHIANKILDNESSLKKNLSNSLFGEIIENNDLSNDNPTFNLIKNKKHPDLLVIEKEIDSKTSKIDKEIKVASARKILDFMTLSPFISKNKVVIIDSIDEMNTSAQNAILKAIEEPAKNTFIFLICHNLNKVLETIQSRCRRINIPNHNFEEWKIILEYTCKDTYKTYTNEQILDLYRLTNGSLSATIDIIEQDGLFLYNHIENLLSQKELNIEHIQNLADQLNNNEKLFTLFSNFIVLFLYRVLQYFSIGNEDNIFKTKNMNFILNNNNKKILEKINLTQEILKDISIFNLSKKHSIIVLFTELIK